MPLSSTHCSFKNTQIGGHTQETLVNVNIAFLVSKKTALDFFNLCMEAIFCENRKLKTEAYY